MAEARARPDSAAVRAHQVADKIRASIEAGEFKPGQRLPPNSELTERYNAAKNTVVKAISILSDQGIVESIERSGVFVLNPNDAALAEQIVNEGNSNALMAELIRRIDEMQEHITELQEDRKRDQEKILRLETRLDSSAD
ncbi:winged helix-turn-helix domain-containing protein [Amycolatopsis sp. NPDC004378]